MAIRYFFQGQASMLKQFTTYRECYWNSKFIEVQQSQKHLFDGDNQQLMDFSLKRA